LEAVLILALHERERKILAIDREIADVEREHTELADEAARNGIAIELMDAERAARIQHAARRDAAERFNTANGRAIRQGHIRRMEVE
jgi:hypothetical protein